MKNFKLTLTLKDLFFLALVGFATYQQIEIGRLSDLVYKITAYLTSTTR